MGRNQIERKKSIVEIEQEHSDLNLTILFYCLSAASICMGVDTVGLRHAGLRLTDLTENSCKYKIIFEEDIIKMKVIKNG